MILVDYCSYNYTNSINYTGILIKVHYFILRKLYIIFLTIIIFPLGSSMKAIQDSKSVLKHITFTLFWGKWIKSKNKSKVPCMLLHFYICLAYNHQCLKSKKKVNKCLCSIVIGFVLGMAKQPEFRNKSCNSYYYL